MRRICLRCGAGYEGRPDSTVCPDCAAAIKHRSTIAPRICRQCGARFEGGPRAWYCPDCRGERKRAHDREAKERARVGTSRKIGSTDICVVCGKPYSVASGTQRYCPDCAPGATREADNRLSREWNAAHIDFAVRARDRQRAAADIACVICGKAFTPTNAAVTCSAECSAELTRRNHAEYERLHRDSRNARRRERAAMRKAAMTPEELAAYIDHKNELARARYKKRRQKDNE